MASHHIAQKKPKTVTSAGKVMGNLFWDSEGCKLVDFLQKGGKMQLATFGRSKNFVVCNKTVILQHDKPRPHTARLTLQVIQKNGWELLFHPPYSPDLAPSNYNLFGPLKDHLRGHHEAVQEAVRIWLRGAGTDFYRRGIFQILQHC
jgi:histone-lysine N-methyltransferase SETMAR